MKPKPKMVGVWCFSVGFSDRRPLVQTVNETRATAVRVRKYWASQSKDVGRLVRIEVPAPVKARKERSKK